MRHDAEQLELSFQRKTRAAENESKFDATGFVYHPETGEVWKDGKRVDYQRTRDYRGICSKGNRVLVHRFAVFYMTGEWPGVKEVDHRDRNKGNNRWENLRLATSSENHCNVPAPKHNRSGEKNVYRDDYHGVWKIAVRKAKRAHYFTASHFFSACVAAPLIRRELHQQFSVNN